MSRRKNWKVLATEVVYCAKPWLELERQRLELPDGRIIDDYHRIRMADCAGAVAQTDDGRYLVTRHYRHGPQRVCITLPGGALDAGETPLEGAKRELREETGYEARDWKPLGSYTMNANYGCGVVHFFLATGARQTTSPESGDLEDTELLLLDRKALRASLRNGEVQVLAAATGILLALSE